MARDYTITQQGYSRTFTVTTGGGGGAGGAGDMLAATYDPTSVEGDAFAMGNMAEGADAKVLTAAERAAIAASTSHTSDTNNPHSVTAAQVGLGSANNTSDADKPISTATQTALDDKADDADLTSHTSDTNNPHSVTAAQVGLGSANNTSDADKPISTATQTALDDKADDADLTSHTSDTNNPHSVTAAQVGLGSVDDTSDADKPVSTATQTALDGKQGASEGSYNSDLEAVQGGLSLGSTYTSHGVLRVLEKSLTGDAFFWLLGDEASGNALDSSDNSRDFIAQNAPTTTTAGGFTGRSFDGVDQHFRLSSNIPNTSGSWHIAAHVYADSLSVDRPVMCQGTSTGNDRAFFFRIESTGALTIHVSSDGTNTAQTVVTSTSGLISTGGWHYVEAYHDANNSEVGVAVDGGLWTFAAHSGGIFQPITQDDIEVGIQRFTSTLDFDGSIRHIGMWNRRLTPEERQYLYNAGTPKAWDFTS